MPLGTEVGLGPVDIVRTDWLQGSMIGISYSEHKSLANEAVGDIDFIRSLLRLVHAVSLISGRSWLQESRVRYMLQ